MLKRSLILVLSLVAAVPAVAAVCDLQMTLNSHGNTFTATTTNHGTGSCSGFIYSVFLVWDSTANVQLSAPHVSIPMDDCIDSSFFGEEFDLAYAACVGHGSLGPGQSFTSRTMVSGRLNVPLEALTWIGDQDGEEGFYAYATSNVMTPTCVPVISAPPIVPSGTEFTVSWTGVSDPTAQFILQRSTTPDFHADVTEFQVNGLSKTFSHQNATNTVYYYRVRATHCAGGTPDFSRTTQTVIQGDPPPVSESGDAAVPFGSTDPVTFEVFVPGRGPNATFTARTDRPYLTVTPTSGPLPPQGTTLTATFNPADLPPGASTGTVIVTITTPDLLTGGVTTDDVSAMATTTLNIPITVSLVTPVNPGGKTMPPPNALIIPVVTHVNVDFGQFLSDVRLTNASGQPIDYQITMTPTRSDARTSSKLTQVTVAGNTTVALNDIVKNFFGFGATGAPSDSGFGSLEIRPLNTSSTLTYAASRTYAATAQGTFGQFIAAMPFTKFATRRLDTAPIPGNPVVSPKLLSLQHVSQSPQFRTNLGLAEGAGEAASGRIRIFNAAGTLLKEIPYNLLPGEHRQMNRFIADSAFGGIGLLEDGRIEVTIDSPTGAVTAYASVLDGKTDDPLAVMPADVENISANRYVVPGMAEIPAGQQNFHSDLRVFNAGSDTTINMTYYPQGGGAPVAAAPRTIRSGEVLVMDNVLPTVFNASNGGSIVITTPSNSSLVATGRTYTTLEDGGTFGQFIPGVMPSEGIGSGDRALQILQLEESSQFRSNIGLAELTGNPVTVRLSVHVPGSIATPFVDVPLAANEFRQLRPIRTLLGTDQIYNARVSVQVLAGSPGRVTAYGSVIDNESKDPTYVPAQ